MLVIISTSYISVNGQQASSRAPKYYLIELSNKNGTPYQLSKPEAFLSSRSITRKLRFNIKIDSTDLPVNPAYLASIASLDLTIINASRWMNQVLIKSSNDAIVDELRKLQFVKNCVDYTSSDQSVSQEVRPSQSKRAADDVNSSSSSSSSIARALNTFYSSANGEEERPQDSSATPIDILGQLLNLKSDTSAVLLSNSLPINNLLNYGNNAPQVQIHQGAYLHNAGFTGAGILIAVLDAGFEGYKTNPLFDSLNMQNRVLKEWDFVENESSVNEDHVHGMQCLSTLAANKPGTMIGTAPHADYLLFRTEDAVREMPYEEHTWLVAAEIADSAGADLISSSLGYVEFDNKSFTHSYADRDGKTTLISRAANMAAMKGMLVVCSAGNNGNKNNDSKYVSCPADAALVFSVGAVNTSGDAAGFSSIGPAYGGQIKPNVVSVGSTAVIGTKSGATTTGNGTSISAPNLAGLIACLWQAFPKATNVEVMEAVQKTADKYLSPTNKLGYGLPDFKRAAEFLQLNESKKQYQQILGRNNIKAYPVPFQDELNLSFLANIDGNIAIRLIDVNGKQINSQNKLVKKNQYYTVHFSGLSNLQSGVYYIQTIDGGSNTMLPVMRQ